MKKFFFLAAALVAAVSMNAQFTGFDGRDGSLGQQIHSGDLVTDLDNITLKETDTDAHKYEIQLTAGGEGTFYMGDIEFWYSNSNPGTVAYKSYGTYIQPNGNKRKVTIPVNPGQTVNVYVQDAQSGVALEGATVTSINLVGWGSDKNTPNAITAAAGSHAIVMWSDDRSEAYNVAKFKLGAIIYDGAQAVENTTDVVKATKVIENGQLVIIKNGVRYNAVGAQF